MDRNLRKTKELRYWSNARDLPIDMIPGAESP